MRPPKSVIEAAIRASGGNLSKTAALLECSRTSLYTWIYQLGLQRLAGIRVDEQDDSGRADTAAKRSGDVSATGVHPAGSNEPTLRLVETSEAVVKVPATTRIDEALWKRLKKEAIDEGCNPSDLVERAISDFLNRPRDAKQKKGGEER